MKKLRIVPSILSGDFGALAEEAKKIEEAGADEIHLDIMDGHFVPNLTMGPKAVAAVNKATSLFLDVHLMMYNPYDYIEKFVASGADRITFHFEATEDVEETIAFIHKCNVEAGIAFNPETNASFATKFFGQCELILMMSVHPGFGGQTFIPDVLEKITFVHEQYQKWKKSSKEASELILQVDGGINITTAAKAIESGANSLVAGTYLFSSPDMKQSIEELRNLKR